MANTDQFRPPKLGIGMIYSAALQPYLERYPEALDVLELEPQTLWLAQTPIDGPFKEFRPAIDRFAALPQRKLVHSVGIPLGGTRCPDPAQIALVRETAERLASPWVSDHLSVAGTPHESAGFFLPPLQTENGVETAVRNIRSFADGIGQPVAVETGVAYLGRKPFEMEDGDYIREVVTRADCGILLDLHNLYCNHRNGRIDMMKTLEQIPFDRVWEVHLAGGEDMNGAWLDSHSGEMPADLAALSREVIPDLPNLGAMNFEIYDTFLERLPDGAFERIVDDMRATWDRAGHARSDARPSDLGPKTTRSAPNEPDPETWEADLSRAVWKDTPDLHPFREDTMGVRLYALLVRSFRGSMIARALPRVVRYGFLRDATAFDDALNAYFEANAPALYAPLEAEGFCDWLRKTGEDDRLMIGLMDYDLAFVRILNTSGAQIVHFPGDPGPVFEALAASELPKLPAPPEWEIEILPDMIKAEDFISAGSGS